MKKLEFMNLNTNKFHDELLINNIIPKIVESKDNLTWITIPEDTPQEIIEQINYLASIHDPAPLPLRPTQDDYLIDLDFRLSLIELGL